MVKALPLPPENAAPKPVKTKKPRSRNTVAWAVAAASGAVALGAGYVGISTYLAPEPVATVIVTTAPVRANAPLTTEKLTTVLMDEADVPVGALTTEQYQAANFFAKVNLPAGEVLTETVAQTATRTITDVPAGMVIASFAVAPEDAVAGKIQPGSYVDVLSGVATDGAPARVVLENVYVLDAQSAPSNSDTSVDADSQPGPNNPALYGGIPTLYTVAVTPDQALVLASSRSSGLYLVLRPVVPAVEGDVVPSGEIAYPDGGSGPEAPVDGEADGQGE